MKSIENILKNSISIWDNLDIKIQEKLTNSSKIVNYKKGAIIQKGNDSCLGLIIVKKGTLRTFLSSPSGKEITLYKLLDSDICLFSASCTMKGIDFDIFIQFEEDSEILLVPSKEYKAILDNSNLFYNYINSILSSRFSEVMWVFEQFVFDSLDKRVANYLIEQGNNNLSITHEKIANDLGTAREVISRILKYFEKENILELSRNSIKIIDEKKLINISEKS